MTPVHEYDDAEPLTEEHWQQLRRVAERIWNARREQWPDVVLTVDAVARERVAVVVLAAQEVFHGGGN